MQGVLNALSQTSGDTARSRRVVYRRVVRRTASVGRRSASVVRRTTVGCGVARENLLKCGKSLAPEFTINRESVFGLE